jgi:hypothetical protein
MNILRSGNKMSVSLQQELAEFNIVRDKAEDGTHGMKGKDPKYFGISRNGKDMFFPSENITELDNQYGMDMAVLVPSGTGTFDLIKPTFGQKLNMKEPKTIRTYLRKLLESV